MNKQQHDQANNIIKKLSHQYLKDLNVELTESFSGLSVDTLNKLNEQIALTYPDSPLLPLFNKTISFKDIVITESFSKLFLNMVHKAETTFEKYLVMLMTKVILSQTTST